MTLQDKINSALAQGRANDAYTAYLQGIGFKKLGTKYSGFAVSAFKRCIELDKDGLYIENSKKSLVEIFKNHNLPIPTEIQCLLS
jgi:hypothetical protein